MSGISSEIWSRGWRWLLAPAQNKQQWQKAHVRGPVWGLAPGGFTGSAAALTHFVELQCDPMRPFPESFLRVLGTAEEFGA